MREETWTVGKQATNGPDHTLAGADIDGKGEEPKVFSVVDLRAYVKPEMDEELTSSDGLAADYGIETVCECVPVEDCVCNTVAYYSGGNSDPCSCVSTCAPLYWFPY